VKILLDECVDWRLSRALIGPEVKGARQMGWNAIKNGELLALASKHFDVFLTVDMNLVFQQNIRIAAPGCGSSGTYQSACRPSPSSS
jgi:hypothetical protein